MVACNLCWCFVSRDILQLDHCSKSESNIAYRVFVMYRIAIVWSLR
jgi:hypothetical protein